MSFLITARRYRGIFLSSECIKASPWSCLPNVLLTDMCMGLILLRACRRIGGKSPKARSKQSRLASRAQTWLVKGLFKHTLPSFVKEWSSQACLVHVDCVLYHSTVDCLLPLLPRCQRGTVILFDEYYNYDGFAKHEWLAWREIRARYKVRAQCIAYDGKRAAFKITDLGDLESSKLDYLNVVADARPGRRSGATSA